MIEVTPITFAEARRFVVHHHRHSRPPVSWLFGCALSDGEEIRGVAIVGRPVARGLQDGRTAEITRCCTDGVKNGCSMLYAACWRAARALGYRRLVTYILDTEKGSSVSAAGFVEVARVKGRQWDTPSRPRVDHHPKQGKIRFQKGEA